MEIPALWQKYNKQVEAMHGVRNETGEACIGLCISPEGGPEEEGFEYVAGTLVSKVEDLPEGFVAREVPEYTYAVFAHKGDLPGLGKTL